MAKPYRQKEIKRKPLPGWRPTKKTNNRKALQAGVGPDGQAAGKT
jgi:hypothetical protein